MEQLLVRGLVGENDDRAAHLKATLPLPKDVTSIIIAYATRPLEILVAILNGRNFGSRYSNGVFENNYDPLARPYQQVLIQFRSVNGADTYVLTDILDFLAFLLGEESDITNKLFTRVNPSSHITTELITGAIAKMRIAAHELVTS
jgi:hypothetical protein